jgi:hypothetical protein
MKKYLAFYGLCYYPSGGMEDFIGEFDSISEAQKAIEEKHNELRPDDPTWEYTWAHIYSTELKQIVFTKSESK